MPNEEIMHKGYNFGKIKCTTPDLLALEGQRSRACNNCILATLVDMGVDQCRLLNKSSRATVALPFTKPKHSFVAQNLVQ